MEVFRIIPVLDSPNFSERTRPASCERGFVSLSIQSNKRFSIASSFSRIEWASQN